MRSERPAERIDAVANTLVVIIVGEHNEHLHMDMAANACEISKSLFLDALISRVLEIDNVVQLREVVVWKR